ncbi:tripartite tricarboxylate transporter TctB family protein [Falsiroseomonas oryziterrae]|uniref:tripartite tricarboxylate transporter TctB family protein n=1 Tax=Falsiroseomonas oryziterrae TaxID=2911368 RepID=UPI001F450305|nr:tripartite tricarboxylate transporter TctB family protein [Roseomonas sp. NPKOSM-4]
MKPSAAPSRWSNTNRISAALVALVAAAAFAGTFFFDPVPPGLPGLGAVEFPRLICVIILGLALLLALQEPGPPDPDNVAPDRGALMIWACCLLFVPAMALFGMLGAGFLFLVTTGWIWGERRAALLLGVAGASTLVLWLVFVKVFRLTLPGGLLFGT